MSGSREKLRAVLLSFVMVTSVLAAGVAFSGSAAAGASGLTGEVKFEDDQGTLVQTNGVVPGMTVQVGPVNVDSANGNDAVFAFDVDGNNDIEQNEVIEVVQDGSDADLSGDSEDGQVTARLNFTDAPAISVGTDTADSFYTLTVIEDTNGNGNLDTGSLDGFSFGDNDDVSAVTTEELILADAVAIARGGGAEKGAGADALSDIGTSETGFNDNDRVVVSPDHSGSGGTYSGTTTIDSSIILESAFGQATIDGTNDPLIDVTASGVRITNLSIEPGDGATGISASGGGTLTVNETDFTLNSDGAGTFGIKSSTAGQGLDLDNSTFDSGDADDITADGANDFEYGIRMYRTGDNVDVRNTDFEDLRYGVQLEGGSNHNFDSNTFTRIYTESIIFTADSNDMDVSGVSVTNNDFDTVGQGVYFIEDGSEFTTGSPKVTGNNFNSIHSQYGTGSLAVGTGTNDRFGGSGAIGRTINATLNWWGDASGPNRIDSSGAKVSDEAVYAPWYAAKDFSAIRTDTSGSIQDAVNNASSGETVVAGSGSYNETLNITTSDITLTSNGSTSATVINSTRNAGTVNVSADKITIEGFTLNGSVDNNVIQSKSNGGVLNVTNSSITVNTDDGKIENSNPDVDGNKGVYGVDSDYTINVVNTTIVGDDNSSAYGVTTRGGDDSDGTLIKNSNISNVTTGLQTRGADNVDVTGTKFTELSASAVFPVGRLSDITAYNITDNNITDVGNAVDVLAKNGNTVSGVDVINNTIVNADQLGEPYHAVAGRESGGTLSKPVNATYNWWGASGGPGNVSDGVGSNVSENVTFRPYLTGAPGADFQIAPQGQIDAALNATPAILLSSPVDGDEFKPPEDRAFTLGTSYNATGNISANDIEIRLIDTENDEILGVNRSNTLGSNGTANVTIPAGNMSGSMDTTVRAQLYNATTGTDNATNTGAVISRESKLNPQNINRNNDNNNGGGGGGGGGGDDTDQEETQSESTDLEETISEAEPTSETEFEVEEGASDGEGATVDTSEGGGSVQSVTVGDDSVQSVSVTDFTGNEEVIEATEASIEESITEELSEDIEEDVQEDVEEDVQEDVEEDVQEDAEGDVEEGVDRGADGGDTATTTDSGGGSDVSVNVAAVSDISVSSDNGDEQTTATVTMSADTEDIDDPEQASIYHETNDGFEKLPTDIEERTSEVITFSGETESFSVFAVAEVQTGEEEGTTNETEATGESEDSGESDSFIPGFGVPVAIVAMMALALLARRKQQ